VICEALAALAFVLSLASFLRSKKVELEVVEKKLAKKREKERRRYVLAVLLSEGKVEKECLQSAVEGALKELYGTLGLALAKPKVVYYDPVAGAVIIRTTLEGVKLLASALMLLEEACGAKAGLVPLRAFGTLSSARDKVPKLNKYVKDLQ